MREVNPNKPVLVIHGGAGALRQETSGREASCHEGLRDAFEDGMRILKPGGSALDAVEQAVRSLEDNPLFNAGRGAAYNSAGRQEMDASIMDGATMQAGAVAAV